MKVTSRYGYRGEDNGSEIVIAAGETVEVSAEKGKQLKRDFPSDFAFDASPSERDDIEREMLERETARDEVLGQTGVDVSVLKTDFTDSEDPQAFVESLDGEQAKLLLTLIVREAVSEDAGDDSDESADAGEKLTGEALHARAAELDIEGRSDMSADELRSAIAVAETPGNPDLAGEALHARAAELDIEGRSDLSAAELRSAIAIREGELQENVVTEPGIETPPEAAAVTAPGVETAPEGIGTAEHVGAGPEREQPTEPEEEAMRDPENADPKAQREAAKRRAAESKKTAARKQRGKASKTSRKPRNTAS